MASKVPPSSIRAPAGVPPSGNAKYAIVAVLLLALVGGAIAWKLTQKAPEPPITITVSPEAGPSARPPRTTWDDDVPLPPPSLDAGEEAGKKPVNAIAAGNPCDVKACSGKNSTELDTALSFRVKQAHRCYDTALAQDPTLKGKVTVNVRVAANGQVCSAGVASNDMGSAGVASCVAGFFRGASFPPPRGGCVDINIPINFVPRQ